MGAPHAPLEERFWRFVSPEPNSGCWLWLGSVDGHGYGQIAVGGGKRRTATHVSLEISGRPRPGAGRDASALHSCDNPNCVNPDHLRWGSHRENQLESRSRGRADHSGLASGHAMMRAKKASRPDRACDCCGKMHKPSAWQEKHNKHFFCSAACSIAWQKANYTGKPIASWSRSAGAPIRERASA